MGLGNGMGKSNEETKKRTEEENRKNTFFLDFSFQKYFLFSAPRIDWFPTLFVCIRM